MSSQCDKVGWYADGELTDEDAETFRVHLETCKTCKRELAWTLALVERLRELGKVMKNRGKK